MNKIKARLKRIWPIKYRKYIKRPMGRTLNLDNYWDKDAKCTGWGLYGKRMKKLWPIYTFFTDTLPDFIFRYPFNHYGWTDFIWWFKYRLIPKYRYHIVKTGLKPGYHDWQDRILYGAMNDFVSRYPNTKETIVIEPHIIKELDRIVIWWNNYEKTKKWLDEVVLRSWSNLRKIKHNQQQAEELLKFMNKQETLLCEQEEKNLKYLIENRWNIDW